MGILCMFIVQEPSQHDSDWANMTGVSIWGTE